MRVRGKHVVLVLVLIGVAVIGIRLVMSGDAEAGFSTFTFEPLNGPADPADIGPRQGDRPSLEELRGEDR